MTKLMCCRSSFLHRSASQSSVSHAICRYWDVSAAFRYRWCPAGRSNQTSIYGTLCSSMQINMSLESYGPERSFYAVSLGWFRTKSSFNSRLLVVPSLCFADSYPALIPMLSVLELGSGTGLAAIMAAKLNARVHATDGDENSVALITRNIERNHVMGTCTPMRLLWGENTYLFPHADHVIGSDIVYV